MRETCARVLAAALMTGAIATVVAMSTLFSMPRQSGQALTAPPSSLRRAIIVAALPPLRHQPNRKPTLPAEGSSARPVVVVQVPVVVHARPRPAPRDLAAAKAKAKVKPASAARAAASVASVTPPPAPPTATAPTQNTTVDAHGNGAAKGHADDHGNEDHGQGGGHDEKKGGHGN
jgi:hypothetical protein